MTKELDELLASVQGKPQRPPVREFRPDAKEHWANRTRESLWELKDGVKYIVVGTNSGTYDTFRSHVIRFALADLKVYELDATKRFSLNPELNECQQVAEAGHINCIRKKDGLQYQNMEEGATSVWLGEKQFYQSIKAEGVDRVTMKVFRDANILSEVENIQRRIINIHNQASFISKEERIQRLQTTEKNMTRLFDIYTRYEYIPWLSSEELKERLGLCVTAIKGLYELELG